MIVPNFEQIGRTVAEIWPFSIFQDGGRPPLSLKMPIHAHFGGVLGVKIGEIGNFL